MSTIGAVGRGDDKIIRGRVATLTMALDFRLEKNPRYVKGQSPASVPSLLVIADGPQGIPVACGAAWPRIATRGDNPGSKFYTMTIDDPSLDAPLHVTMFPVAGGDPQKQRYDVVWRRARRGAAPAIAAPGEDEDSAPSDGAPLDDEIPF
jgi:uncharacterized protein (DUF736 family)